VFSNLFREIDENALEQALSAAVTCTILAGAGPQRSRVLATLYKVIPFWITNRILSCLLIYCFLFLNIFLLTGWALLQAEDLSYPAEGSISYYLQLFPLVDKHTFSCYWTYSIVWTHILLLFKPAWCLL